MTPSEKNAEFTVLEAGLPGVLGVSRDMIRAIRFEQFTEGLDWVKRHKDILLTEEAVEGIRRTLALIKGDRDAAQGDGSGVAVTGPGARDEALFDGPSPAVVQAGTGTPSPRPSPPGEGEEGTLKKVEVFKVLRSGFKNRLVVQAYDPLDRKRVVWVRVKDNSKWVPHMEIEATHLQHDQYVLHGNNPRFRGKR